MTLETSDNEHYFWALKFLRVQSAALSVLGFQTEVERRLPLVTTAQRINRLYLAGREHSTSYCSASIGLTTDQAQQTYVYKGHTGGENLFSSRIKQIVNYCVFENFCCSHKGGFIFHLVSHHFCINTHDNSFGRKRWKLYSKSIERWNEKKSFHSC